VRSERRLLVAQRVGSVHVTACMHIGLRCGRAGEDAPRRIASLPTTGGRRCSARPFGPRGIPVLQLVNEDHGRCTLAGIIPAREACHVQCATLAPWPAEPEVLRAGGMMPPARSARMSARPTASVAVANCRHQYASACYTPQQLRVAYEIQPLLIGHNVLDVSSRAAAARAGRGPGCHGSAGRPGRLAGLTRASRGRPDDDPGDPRPAAADRRHAPPVTAQNAHPWPVTKALRISRLLKRVTFPALITFVIHHRHRPGPANGRNCRPYCRAPMLAPAGQDGGGW
jgi:hypothetical protein